MRKPRCCNEIGIACLFGFQVGNVHSFATYGRIVADSTTTNHLPLFLANDDNHRNEIAGPKGDRRSGPRTSSRSGPRQRPQRRQRERPTERLSKKKEENFDGLRLTAAQIPNLEAPAFDLRASMTTTKDASAQSIRCVTTGMTCVASDGTRDSTAATDDSSFEYMSLDDLLGDSLPTGFSLSQKFNADESFRTQLRSAIRLDVFETTPYYAKLSEKAKSVLLLPDSSLEGSWRLPEESEKAESSSLRMKHTTRVLHQALDEHFGSGTPDDNYFSGDDLFRALGTICGPGASTHWIDIFGVQDRKINHSWHLDAGQSPQNCRTLLWGFPPSNDYEGTGVFSHIVSLCEPFDEMVGEESLENHNRMEPILFEGTVEEKHIVRPIYKAGHELLFYRDVDVLHSAPDVAYRASVMRFM